MTYHVQATPVRTCDAPMASLLSALLFLAPLPALAFQPLVTDDTGTQGTGGNQLEIAVSRVRAAGGDVTREAPLTYTRGITDALDFFIEKARIENRPAATRGESGWGNTVFGAKWRFHETDGGTSLALKPAASFPVGAADEGVFGTGRLSFDAAFIFTQETGWGALHANLWAGRERNRDPAGDLDSWLVSAAPVASIGERWKVALDFGAGREKDANDAATRRRFAEIGVIFAPNEDLEIAIGVIRQRAEDAAGAASYQSEATTGITWRFR
jgi:hypothetical protein